MAHVTPSHPSNLPLSSSHSQEVALTLQNSYCCLQRPAVAVCDDLSFSRDYEDHMVVKLTTYKKTSSEVDEMNRASFLCGGVVVCCVVWCGVVGARQFSYVRVKQITC